MMNYGRVDVPDGLVEAIERVFGHKVTIGRGRTGPHSTVLFMEGRTRSFVAKVYATVDRDRITESLRLSRLAADHGAPAVLPLKPHEGGADNPTVSLRPSGQTIQFFVLFPYLGGQTYSAGRTDQIRSAARALAWLHRTCHRADATVSDADVFARFADGLRRLPDGDVVRDLSERVDTARLRTVTCGLCHGDYRAQNLVYRGSRVAGVLDFDDARFGTRLWDLAYATVFFGAAVAPSGPLPVERSAFLKAYHGVYPLGDQEIDQLPSYLCWAAARGLALWRRLAQDAQPEVRGRLEAWHTSYAPTADWCIHLAPDQIGALLDG